MSIKLNGSNSGSIEIDVPADAGLNTAITFPATSGTVDRLERAGNILQVVKYQRLGSGGPLSSLAAPSSGAGFVTLMTKDITTTVANSKILVIVEYISFNSTRGEIRILRNGSQVSADPYAHYTADSEEMVNYSSTFEDAPSVSAGTTLTYLVECQSGSGVCYFGYGDSAGGGSAILALMEIAP